MKLKPETPYERLLKSVRRWASRIAYRKRISMCTIEREPILSRTPYVVDDIYFQVETANRLGFEVHVSISDKRQAPALVRVRGEGTG